MTALGWVNSVLLGIHILSVIGLLVLLLLQFKKSPRTIHPGAMHSALTALVAGLAMVGLRTPLHSENADKWPLLNNGWVGIKFAVLIAILILIVRNFKKPEIKNSLWLTLVGLTTLNILIALFWK